MKEEYIKCDRIKQIHLRLSSYTGDLIKDNWIEMKYIQSANNATDLFTKALPIETFRKHAHSIGYYSIQFGFKIEDEMIRSPLWGIFPEWVVGCRVRISADALKPFEWKLDG
ncbi:hypothetical protein OSB04_025481 [Centaurea solstitialis]|uniref:Uncharacterized protein n=1 Tax=Centaurea solstitialis TaxID=347529 RepID=A0AA38SN62_9ASTR|nr:hypothetical protein OSB04_025481 [Centaurea solstitialis]